MDLFLSESAAAQYSENSVRQNRQYLQNSNVLGIASVRDDLGGVWEECRVPGWDGYGALPVEQDTLRNVYLFLESLPLGTPVPTVGAEADGAMTLEWQQSRRRTLSVSIHADGALHYAALLGPARVCGTEFFMGDVPSRIYELIYQVA